MGENNVAPINNNLTKYTLHRFRPRCTMEGTILLAVSLLVILLIIYYFTLL
jgi:hypothetical protein